MQETQVKIVNAQFVKLLRSVAHYYKPIDKKMMRLPGYIHVSDGMKNCYGRVIKGKSVKGKPVKKIVNHYLSKCASADVERAAVLFETFWGRSISCNPYAIYKGMSADNRFDGYRFIWVTNLNTGIPESVKNDPRVEFVHHGSKAYKEAIATCGVLVNNTTFPPYFVRRPEQVYINTYHGIPIKKMGFDIDDTLASIANTQRNFIQATHLLTGGEYTENFLFKPYGAMPIFKERFLQSGYPRIDLTQRKPSQAFLARLGISGKRPVVLFAPTWRGTVGTMQDEVDEVIRNVQTLYDNLSENCDVFVSLHNLIIKNAKSIPEGIRLIPPGVDVNEFLSVTDVLISDYSSILVDYLALDRALVLFVPDRMQYEDSRGLYISLEELPGEICTTIEEVVEATRVARSPSEFDNFEAAVQKLLPNQDGGATSRVLDAILTPRVEKVVEKKKRILLVMNALQNNGITSSFINLTRTLDHDSYDVFVIFDASALDKSTVDMVNFYKIDQRCFRLLRIGKFDLSEIETQPVHDFSNPSVEISATSRQISKSAFVRESQRLVSDVEFDAAVCFSGYSPYWAQVVCGMNVDRKVIFQHNDLHAEYINPLKAHKRLIGVFRSLHEFDVIAPVSQEVGEVNYRNLSDFYSSKDQVKTVRNTIDVNRIFERAEEPLGVTCPSMAAYADLPILKIVTLGRLSPEKNQARLIKAFGLARNRGLDAVLFIAGSGPLEEKLKSLANRLGVADRVLFVGQLSNPYPYLKAADCFVLSSDYEGQPVTLLEALTIGTYCIGTDIPGIRAVLNRTHNLVTKPTAENLAEALISLSQGKGQTSSERFVSGSYTKEAVTEFEVAVFGGAFSRPSETLSVDASRT